jgi:UDP-glucose 4-epimerase
MSDPDIDLEINCKAQLGLMEALRQANHDARVVFARTRQVYGRPQYLPVDVRPPVTPSYVNGINKDAGEQYHLLYSTVYGRYQ